MKVHEQQKKVEDEERGETRREERKRKYIVMNSILEHSIIKNHLNKLFNDYKKNHVLPDTSLDGTVILTF